MKKTYCITTLGCRVNQAESEQMKRELAAVDFVYDTENPQLYIVNSCCVTQKAERKTRQRVRYLKKLYPNSTLYSIVGCQVVKNLRNGLTQDTSSIRP